MMNKIVLIEDSNTDAFEIISILRNSDTFSSFKIKHFSTLRSGLNHLKANPVDLLLLDLEFTDENITATSLIDEIPRLIPILIISNLSHYQKPLSYKINVKGFISKSHLSHDLLPYIEKTLGTLQAPSAVPTKFLFPSPNSKYISESIVLNEIRYIEFSNRQIYTIYLIDGSIKIVHSLPYRDICSQLTHQNIECLCPITKNQIINMNYISSITKSENGRYQIKLVNLPDKIFNVGVKHQTNFKSFFS